MTCVHTRPKVMSRTKIEKTFNLKSPQNSEDLNKLKLNLIWQSKRLCSSYNIRGKNQILNDYQYYFKEEMRFVQI